MCMPGTQGMSIELTSDAVNAELAQWYMHIHYMVCVCVYYKLNAPIVFYSFSL